MSREKEQRETLRVSVKPDRGLKASLQFAGKEWPGTVGDISPEGLFIKLEHGTLPALKVDSHVNVEITFDDEKVLLHGIIRWHRAGGYGVFFPERGPQGHVNRRAKLEKISAHLQRIDLSQRLKVLKLPE
ncbi:MAG TPA: PilZ domain-containing protein [Gammaproteobacteria bacterium]|nr:PilZ domain-containing protein [Gammaproteobacteria bacterium]